MLSALNHVNILSANMDKTAAFYTQLGFRIGHRPLGFPDPGIWLYVDEKPVLHINPITGPRAKCNGREEADLREAAHWLRTVDHFGFSVRGTVKEVTAKLEELSIEYDLWSPIPGANRALYFVDPTTGARIEYVMVDEFVGENHADTSQSAKSTEVPCKVSDPLG